MKIIVMGPQGSGKSTQARLLAERLRLPHLETGELYRQIAQGNNDFAHYLAGILQKGELVPDKDHNRILSNAVAKPQYQAGFVLDGSPRTLAQAETLPFLPDKVFYLAVSDVESIKRLAKRGRDDDTPELIAQRLRIYHDQTEPVLDYYRKRQILEEVDGERPIEEILEDLLKSARR